MTGSEDPMDRWDDDALRAAFAELDDPPGPFLGPEARRRAARRTTVRRLAAAVLLVGLVGVAAVLGAPDDDSSLRARSVPGAAPVLHFDHLVEHGDGSLDRAGVTTLGLDDLLVFRASASVAGFVCVDEILADGGEPQRVLPVDEAGWEVDSRPSNARVDGRPAGFVTDRGPGRRGYRAMLDLEDPACGSPVAEETLWIDWTP